MQGTTLCGCTGLAVCTREQAALGLCPCVAAAQGGGGGSGGGCAVQGDNMLWVCACFSAWHSLCVTVPVRVCEHRVLEAVRASECVVS